MIKDRLLRGVKAVTGMEMPVFPKDAFSMALSLPIFDFSGERWDYRKSFCQSMVISGYQDQRPWILSTG
jgi:hypothetical protein